MDREVPALHPVRPERTTAGRLRTRARIGTLRGHRDESSHAAACTGRGLPHGGSGPEDAEIGTPSRRLAFAVIAVWLAALAGGLAVAPRLGTVSVTDPIRFFPDDAPSRVAARALGRLFPDAQAASQLVVVLEAELPGGSVAEEPVLGRVRALASALRAALPEDLAPAVLAPTGDPVLGERLASRDGRAALVVVPLRAGFASEAASAAVAEAEALVARELAGSGLAASFSGHATLGRDYLRAIEEGARRSALATVILIGVVLLLVHRAPIAALVSLASLGIALGVASGAVTLAAMAGLPVAFQARGFLVALVWGVGTDYCLLLFARLREERDLRRAVRASTPVIVTSALAVGVACALMGAASFGLFAYSGPALALGVAVTLAAVLTLAPALMHVAAGTLFWPHRVRPGPSAAAASGGTGTEPGLWPRIARLVVARPALVFASTLLAVLPFALHGIDAEPSFELELDIPEGSASEAGWKALVRHFDPARVGPLTIAVELPEGGSLRDGAGLDALYQATEWMATQPGVARVWSATRPTGEPGLLARGTLRSQLGELALGLAEAREGGGRLADGLAAARGEIARGRAGIASKRGAIAQEQTSSLLGAFAPERFEEARRDLAGFDGQLARLHAGLGEAEEGARRISEGLARGERRLADLGAAPGAARLLDRLALTGEDVSSAPELVRAFGHYLSGDARAARFEIQLADGPGSAAAVATLARLERDLAAVLPALGLPGAQVHAFGATPITADLAVLTRADLGRLDVWIVAGVFALLVLLLRGIAAPIAVTAFILLSYFAALGALRLLVDAGVWRGLDWKAPFFLFVLLVAIGADYGVFLLGRAREEALRLPYEQALARALTATGPVVTSCGLVLAGTFATLGLSRIAFLEQVGVGITVGVLVDTGLVRPFLLPAAALLLQRDAAPPPGGSAS